MIYYAVIIPNLPFSMFLLSGALFAALGVLDGLAMFLSPLIINGLYAATVDILTTLVFFVMAAMMLMTTVLTG